MIQPVLQEDQFFAVDIQVSINKIRSKLVILLDSDEGIGIDQCGALSREIGALLDEKIEDAYVLEVSSPGVDTPLTARSSIQKKCGSIGQGRFKRWTGDQRQAGNGDGGLM